MISRASSHFFAKLKQTIQFNSIQNFVVLPFKLWKIFQTSLWGANLMMPYTCPIFRRKENKAELKR